MEKRTERNKTLYDKVNKEIEKAAKKHSNEDFKATNEKLKNINPELFGETNTKIEKKEKLDPSKKKALKTTLIFIILVIIIILLAVVIYYGNK